jgi:hypothetical protein
VDVYLEETRRRTFACAVEWRGWCRAGKTEDEALDALIEYGPRYKTALGKAAADLDLPLDRSDLKVVARLPGNPTTEFGAPGVVPDMDRVPTTAAELERLFDLARASWRAFERSAAAAEGAELVPAGPRGGGRSLEAIVGHVAEADGAYVRGLGGKVDPKADWAAIQEAFIGAAKARAAGELPERGPRGGQRWPAPYAIRRSAWHSLDHAWEIEDRKRRSP